MNAPAVVVVAASGAATTVALAGWAWHAAARGAPMRRRRTEAVRRAGTVVLTVLALAAAPLAPAAGVMALLIALNLLLGSRENVPFSTYPMFSQPRSEAWTLRFEDLAGDLVPLAGFGILPPTAKKQFGTEVAVRRALDVPLEEARREAAGIVATTIEQRRPPTGPMSDQPVRIVLVEYSFDGTSVTSARHVLAVTEPS